MIKHIGARMLAIVVVAAGLTLMTGCNDREVAREAAANTDPSLVQVSPEIVAQLKVDHVATAPVADTLRIAGRVDFDEQRLSRIGATVTGRVTGIHASLGQTVRAGDTLAELNSTELSAAQLAFLKTRAQAELLRRNVERAQLLYRNDVIGSAELQRRESEYQIAAAEARAAADQLRVFGMSPAAVNKLAAQGSINSVTAVVSSFPGTVVDRKVTQGQVVQPADALFVVADLSRLWVVAQVPEQQLGDVRTGQNVTVEIPALGNERRSGRLIYVGETVSPETRTVVVRTELDNTDGRLKPAMLATMLIAGKAENRVVIPGSAVVRDGDSDNVFVRTDSHHFRLAPVKLGPEYEGRRPVIAGLSGGESIVVEGAFHLNNERKRKELEGS